jgi:DNA-binding XRE family transcriptional regulator
MLEHTKTPLTDAGPVFLGVICQQTILEEGKAALKAKGCTIREEKPALPPVEERDWLTLKEVFPDFHAGDKLLGLRYRENLTQKQLADKVGISVQNLSHMEHGRRSIGKEMAKRIARALDTDWRLLLS